MCGDCRGVHRVRQNVSRLRDALMLLLVLPLFVGFVVWYEVRLWWRKS